MKKRVVQMCCVMTATMLAMGGAAVVSAEEAPKPGVTVAADEQSPTGYTATFVYEAPDAQKVELTGAFAFYWEDETVRGRTPDTYYTPYEWENGMFEAGDEAVTFEMEKIEGTDLWTISMPLPSGHYQYVFHVDGNEEKLEDPTNPREEANVQSGNRYGRSTIYVPYDAEKQSKSMDFSYMAPREDGKSGTVTYVNYADCNEEIRPLGIYLPYGYDENREEPYKVLYLSHGGTGNEVDWFAGGSVDYIFDNMIAEGTTEPVVLVTMDNTAYRSLESDAIWHFDTIIRNLTEAVMPFVEEHYNVATDSANRAYAGLSIGGLTTSNVLCQCPEVFDYFGIFSGADGALNLEDYDIEALKRPSIMVGAGIYDFTYNHTGEGEDTVSVEGLMRKFDEAGISYGWEEAYGEHDWNVWPQLIKVFAEEYLWK